MKCYIDVGFTYEIRMVSDLDPDTYMISRGILKIGRSVLGGFDCIREYKIYDLPFLTAAQMTRFDEIFSACSSGSIDSLEDPLKSDYWFVLQILQDLIYK